MEFAKSLHRPQVGAIVFGVVSIGYGLRAILTPFEFARDFGLPQAAGTKNAFITATGGRTVALGLAIVSLSLLDNVKASGIVLMSCALSGFTDTVSTYRYGNRGAYVQHGIGTLVLGSFGWYLAAVERVEVG